MTAIVDWLFGAPGEAPFGVHLSGRPGLVALHVAGDLFAAICLIAIPVGMVWFARRRLDLAHRHRALAWWFGGLLLAAGATQIVDLLTIWYPAYGLQALAKAITAAAAIATLVLLWPQLPELVRLPSSKQAADFNRRLRREVAAHEATLRELESTQRELESRVAERTKELSLITARFETALRASKVTVFTQNQDLRYTSISKAMFGFDAQDIVGRTDDDIIPAENRPAMAAMKRQALETGAPQDGEVLITGTSGAHWLDLHIEPLRDGFGTIIGLTCAAVDITERKEGEAHLRLLMRELTHRSKNLLAVIQAMARQTARGSDTLEGFLAQFGDRLQALSKSHDLLVQEGWHGAAMEELVRSQLGHYLDRNSSQVTIKGPALHLRPEAAQSLGLAIHELATNAAKYGALSVPKGQISIEWTLDGAPEPPALKLLWSETGGPAVIVPDHRGFGRLVIERNLAGSLEAEVEMAFPPEGVRCRIVIPATQLLAN